MGIEYEFDRARVSRQDVRYGVADLFTWEPEHSFDVLSFSFWLSHVPRSAFCRFWELVSSALAPSGTSPVFPPSLLSTMRR